ncbi:Protein SENSITIVITY TO RED LIGHT REDUCED 1 [Porphyridium purpureum]|uniref:Protein SENSITIVITY TO RED LIGHT REDUCED 1 n=1 Tax=Porphyridium purpureum TaxID=35688 RepID=A0A5J4YRA9_PORPP|nr:Protein SENSITIVITY TO RED LIGHT REDUCED 1 [Porphyridium purpureum]|eukprot:POR9151..scf222_8
MSNGEWQYVSKRRSRRGVPHERQDLCASVVSASGTDDSQLAMDRLTEQVAVCERNMLESAWTTFVIQQVRLALTCSSDVPRRFSKVVALGLGSFEASANARYQLALLRLLLASEHLHEFFAGDSGQGVAVQIFDPVMSALDREFLRVNFPMYEQREVSSQDTTCFAASQDAPLFMYMPHCGRTLYHNVLHANWSSKAELTQLIVLGNSFRMYAEQYEFRRQDDKPDASYVETCVNNELVKELPLSVHHLAFHVEVQLQYMFNDLSVHSFPRAQLEAAHASVWSLNLPLADLAARQGEMRIKKI